jgi:hypothetical protein
MTSVTHENVPNIETVPNATDLSWRGPDIRDNNVARKVAKVSRNLSSHWAFLKQIKTESNNKINQYILGIVVVIHAFQYRDSEL